MFALVIKLIYCQAMLVHSANSFKRFSTLVDPPAPTAKESRRIAAAPKDLARPPGPARRRSGLGAKGRGSGLTQEVSGRVHVRDENVDPAPTQGAADRRVLALPARRRHAPRDRADLVGVRPHQPGVVTSVIKDLSDIGKTAMVGDGNPKTKRKSKKDGRHTAAHFLHV